MIQLIFWIAVICVAIAYWQWALGLILLWVIFQVWKSLRSSDKSESKPNSSKFLNSDYSPNSRIPQTDFSPQIISSIKRNDEQAIVQVIGNLMPEIEARPLVSSILKLELDKKILATSDVLVELQALMILIGKNRDWSELTRASFYHDAFFVHDFTIVTAARDQVLHLLCQFERKNKEIPPFGYSLDLSLFDTAKRAPKDNSVFMWLKTLPLASRMHFMMALDRNFEKKTPVINLAGSTDYSLRQFGIDIEKSCQTLRKSPVFIPLDSFADFGQRVSKDDLMGMLLKGGVKHTKSMSKTKLCEIADASPALRENLQALIREHNAVKVNQTYKHQLEELMAFYQKMKPLCFAIEFLEFPHKLTAR